MSMVRAWSTASRARTIALWRAFPRSIPSPGSTLNAVWRGMRELI
jgi:hypothetical protein